MEIKMGIIKFIKDRIDIFKNDLYLRRLRYALRRLETPFHNDIDEDERNYLIEIIKWLHDYYDGSPDVYSDGSPDIKLRKILSKPSKFSSPRDHVYSRVLLHWKEYKRIDGF
jgi:hypothetical protein